MQALHLKATIMVACLTASLHMEGQEQCFVGALRYTRGQHASDVDYITFICTALQHACSAESLESTFHRKNTRKYMYVSTCRRRHAWWILLTMRGATGLPDLELDGEAGPSSRGPEDSVTNAGSCSQSTQIYSSERKGNQSGQSSGRETS